jgi:EmrB/QacA subfamily drug resistance transporter
VVVLTGVLMSFLDLLIVNVAFPSIARHFGEPHVARLSWVLNAYTIVFAALLVPAGHWADRMGRKRSFLIGLAMFTVASALCAAAPSLGILIGARILQAAGAAQLLPAAMGLLLWEFPPEKRSVAVALFAAVGGAGAAAGGPIGGLLTQLGWNWVFLINLPIGIFVLFAGARVLREIRESTTIARPDLLGALILAAGIGSLVLVIVKGRDWNWNSGLIVGCGLIAIVLLILFVERSRRHPAPVVEFPMLRVRSFAMANISALFFAIAFSSLVLAGVMFLTAVWKSAPWLLGLQLAPGPLTAAALAVPAGKLCGRIGQRPVALAGVLIFVLGDAWWLWRLGAESGYSTQFLPGLILTGIGAGLSVPAVLSAGVASLPPSRLSTGSAILNMSRQIGLALGVAILVAIIGNADGPNNLTQFRYGYLVIGLAALASGVTCLALKGGDLASSKGQSS